MKQAKIKKDLSEYVFRQCSMGNTDGDLYVKVYMQYMEGQHLEMWTRSICTFQCVVTL